MTIRLVLAPIPENATVYAQKAVDAVKNIEGVDLDYSPESLSLVDGILLGFHRDSEEAEWLADTLFAFGCYAGEVMIRKVGGRWIKQEESPLTAIQGLADFRLLVDLSNRMICNPIGTAFERVENCEAESLAYLCQVFTETRK